MERNAKRINELWEAVLRLKTSAEAGQFFGDLLTADEIDDFAKRWQAARLLDAGVPYQQIQRETALSSRTVARISSWLKEGFGGYRLMLARLGNSHHPASPPHRRSAV